MVRSRLVLQGQRSNSQQNILIPQHCLQASYVKLYEASTKNLSIDQNNTIDKGKRKFLRSQLKSTTLNSVMYTGHDMKLQDISSYRF